MSASGMVYATRKFTFSSAHRYWRPEWSAEDNTRVFGNLTVPHGHNYVLEVTVRGAVEPATGMVMDLGELKRLVGDLLVSRFDHADLNRDAVFASGAIPTTENLVRAIWDLLVPKLGGERLAAEYVGADLFCLPSVQEGFGIVFLEAMAAGLAVVACRAAAVPEVVRDGETGVLAPPRDPEAIARALGGLLQDPGRAQALGEAGRRRVTELTPPRVAERFLHAVESIPGLRRDIQRGD